MPISHIEVHLSRLKFMSIDDCDTDVALAAIKDAIESGLATRYPDCDIFVAWQSRGPDLQYHIVEVKSHDEEPGEDETPDAEAEVARAVETVANDTISGLFVGPPIPWRAWSR